MAIKRIGIMTGGGDCPGLNPVIRAVTKTAIGRYGWEVLGIEDAFNGLVDLDYRSPNGNFMLTEDIVSPILSRGGTIIGTSNKADPFRWVVERDGEKVETDVFDRVVENVAKLGLDAIVSVGGDGTQAITQRCIERGLTNMVGVPKTIDNDLGATDYTFGFDTAVNIAKEAIDRLRDTAESHDRVMLVEVMGRDAGWIALHAGLAGGAHAILVPEIPYRLAPIARMIEDRRGNGRPFSVIVVSEGARPVDGEESYLGERELGGMRRLFGAAARVAEGLGRLIPDDLRFTVLGHTQRGGSPTAFDRILGTRFGEAAVELIAAGKFGRMVALRGLDIVDVPIADACGDVKRVDPEGDLVSAARAMGVVFGNEAP